MKDLLKNRIAALFAGVIMVGLILSSCDDNDTEPVVVPDPIKIDASVSSNSVDAGGKVTFTDASTGVVSRTWSFPGGSVETSTEAVVEVTFPKEGPIVCTLKLKLNDETTETKTFPIQVGTEQFATSIFSFEDEDKAFASFKAWNPTAGASTIGDWSSELASFNVDKTQGAENTSSCLKITVNKADEEIQLFSKENWDADFNGKVDKTKKYTLSLWAKANIATKLDVIAMENQVTIANPDNPDAKFHTWAANAQDWFGYLWDGSDYVKLTTEWQEYTFTIDPIANPDPTKHQPYDMAQNAFVLIKLPREVSTVYIDEISLKEVE